mgnify:CR=1 FL=1
MPPPSNLWTCLEPYARSELLEGGLHAAIHDPLWLLARQWQLGEFQGEDVGSPVHASLQMACTPLTRYQAGGIPPAWFEAAEAPNVVPTVEGQRIDLVPLETLVEREAIRLGGAMQPRLAAEAGLHFRRLLGSHGVSAPLGPFALPTADEEPLKTFDSDTRRFLQVMAGRVPDGQLLYDVLRRIRDGVGSIALSEPYRTRVTAGIQSWQEWKKTLSQADADAATRAETDWLNWYETLFSEPPADGNRSWLPERLEYEFAVAAPTPEGEVVLAAPEYPGGHLDWYSFNTLPTGSLMATTTDLSGNLDVPPSSAIPVPVSFRGMPASRYWEFEDARINFGALNAGRQQLAKLLLIEFGLIAGDDWFVIPVVVPVGSLCRTDALIVTDTFGDGTRISSARDVDQGSEQDGLLPWDLFRLSLDRRPVVGKRRSVPVDLFLPPTLGTSLHGSAIEEVVFLRDEMANMAWAVERLVEGPLGGPLNRSEAYFRSRQKTAVSGSGSATNNEAPPLVYRLATEVPEHWIPLLPVRIRPDAPPIRLQRGRKGQGHILEPRLDAQEKEIPIYEEEVPREGAKVSRAFQYVRWINAQTYLWVGRHKGVGRGEGSSGLRFDVLEPPGKSDS